MEIQQPLQPEGGTKKYVIGIIVIAIIILGASYFAKNRDLYSQEGSDYTETSDTVENSSETVTTDTSVTPIDTLAKSTVTTEVIYTDANGFTPDNLTIKVGDTVKFVNRSSGGMWVGSAMHPTHVVYSGTTLKEHCPDTTGTSFDQCESGSEYSFTFTKVGTWGYHDHLNARMYGKVNVTAN